MSKFEWNKVTRNDVLKAIQLFERDNPEYPEPRSTFVLFDGKKLPAKHIWGMAYKEAFGTEILKSDYAGGLETVRFFHNLGFDVFYKGETIYGVSQHCAFDSGLPKDSACDILQETLCEERKEDGLKDIYCEGIKIGLYLQTESACTPEAFHNAMEIVKNADFDILVFPENCYCPEIEELWQLDIDQENDVDYVRSYCLNLSRKIDKAVVFSPVDKYITPYSVFANHLADETETEFAVYIKHTMAESSAFDFTGYQEIARNMFEPIVYKGHKIGMTICYDCNHAPFSRMWKLGGVNILLNSTGGNVVHDKWYKYNKARAIENKCYNFVTMGGAGLGDNPHSYVYGFSPEGKELPFRNLMADTDRRNAINTVYVFDTALDDGEMQADSSLHQDEKANKHQDYFFPVGNVDAVLEQAKKIDENLYIIHHQGNVLVFCVVEELKIMQPEYPLALLYSNRLSGYQNKRYILINRHEKEIGQEYFEAKLSIVLKVRAMENFCAVILESPNMKHCYQTGNNRTAQVVPAENGYYGIDIARTSGPEAIWKNKPGMKLEWRKNFEWLVSQIQGEEDNTNMAD